MELVRGKSNRKSSFENRLGIFLLPSVTQFVCRQKWRYFYRSGEIGFIATALNHANTVLTIIEQILSASFQPYQKESRKKN
jgi:hypothetical protein